MATNHSSIDQRALENRARFGFPPAVRRHFAYLTDLGFRIVHTEPTYMRFESDQIVVNLYHGRKSCELGAEIGLLGGTEYPFVALIRLTDPDLADSYKNTVALSRENVFKGVQRLGEIFKNHAWGALRGDSTVFARLDEQRRELAHKKARSMKVNHVRPGAAEAFRVKNYERAVQLYESIEGELTDAELKKLEYARKQTG
jgi:hypothetical protein